MNAHPLAEQTISGLALTPQNVNNSAVNGATIAAPWEKGENIVFLLAAGAMTTNDALTITVQRRLASSGAWSAALDKAGASLTFTVSKTSDGGVLDTGFLRGELPLTRMALEGYDAIRLSAVNAAAQNVLLSATYVIGNLRRLPATLDDDLLAKILPST